MTKGWRKESARHALARKGIRTGIKVELEHAKTIKKIRDKNLSLKEAAAEIAKDHLREDSAYYDKLKIVEGEMPDKIGAKEYFEVTKPLGGTTTADHLPIETIVTVPSTRYDKKISKQELNKRILETQKFLSQIFGGYTSIEALGGYIPKKGGLWEEPIVKIISFAKAKDYKKSKKRLAKWLKRKKKEWKQETIAYEQEGDLFLV